MKIFVKAAINDVPKSDDIFNILVITTLEAVEGGLNRSNHGPLNDAFHQIRNHLSNKATFNVGQVVQGAEHNATNHYGTTYYFPFRVIYIDGVAYPRTRWFQIRATYRFTSTGQQHDVELQPGEKLEDFETIFIDGEKKRYPSLVNDAIAFIDRKIEGVRSNTEPDTI